MRDDSATQSVWWLSRVHRVWSSSQGRKRVLIIDDDARLLDLLAILFDIDYEIATATTATDGLALLMPFTPDVIVLDLEMPGMNGRDFYRETRGLGIETPILILSAFGAEAASQELGANAFLNKPFEPLALLEAVRRII
jgi:DNA-binding response OmpR family regulator